MLSAEELADQIAKIFEANNPINPEEALKALGLVMSSVAAASTACSPTSITTLHIEVPHSDLFRSVIHITPYQESEQQLYYEHYPNMAN